MGSSSLEEFHMVTVECFPTSNLPIHDELPVVFEDRDRCKTLVTKTACPRNPVAAKRLCKVGDDPAHALGISTLLKFDRDRLSGHMFALREGGNAARTTATFPPSTTASAWCFTFGCSCGNAPLKGFAPVGAHVCTSKHCKVSPAMDGPTALILTGCSETGHVHFV
eukprot:4722973-Amphidinium_carterae.1